MSEEAPVLFGRTVRHVHCVGVGGMGLGPLAIFLSGCGVTVSGEDDALGDAMRVHLLRGGVRLGPMADDCELVVCSSAISASHPTSVLAAQRQLGVVRRGEMLAELCRGRKLVAVCGSHGKTSTTAMLITALRMSGFPFGYVLGGLFADPELPPARADGEWIVAEIDESDGTIGCFSPEITIPTNLDWDHPDYYPTEESLLQAFGALFARTRGMVLLNRSCPLSMRLQGEARRSLGLGPGGDFDYTILSDQAEGLVLELSGSYGIGRARVKARGSFNAANAAAAMAAAKLMGAPLSDTLLSSYCSVRRRQGVLHEDASLRVVEDYAHHPSEIRALLSSLKQQGLPGARLIVAFQPHRFSRTLQFKAQFAEALLPADAIHLLEVYPAGEAPITGGMAKDLFLCLPQEGLAKATWHGDDSDRCFEAIGASLKEGDCLAVVGAGDIDQMARRWLARRRWTAVAGLLRSRVSPACALKAEEPLAPRTTLRAGGSARLYAEPADESDLCILVQEAARQSLPWYVLGRGSNLLIPDEGVDALVIALCGPAWSSFEALEGGRLRAGAGIRLKELCGAAAKGGLKGFEFLEGIPGTLGGALRMNAGAMNGWIYDLVEELRLMDRDGRILSLRRDQLHVDYRFCRELESALALGAVLRSTGTASTAAICSLMDEYRAKRQASQPREPSAGCMFKNPEGDSAGRLIDQCGLKGESVGDAEVSTVHANFIINRGAASAADVIELVRRVRSRVKTRRGVELEPEVQLLGKSWSSVL